MKAHLLQVLVVDDNYLGLDEVVRVFEEDTDYRDSIEPHVISTQSIEVEGDLVQTEDITKLFSAWQPIATAPKDGTHILLYYQGNVYSGWYEKSEEFTFVDKHGKEHTRYSYWHIDSPDDNCWYDIEDEIPEYSYWMPLPNPPLG